MFKFSKRSINNMQGIHPHLRAWCDRLIQITPIDFVVLEGRRTIERQAQLVAEGASRTMNSRHITGHAVDLGAWLGTIRWELTLYCRIAEAGRQACYDLGVPIRWGGAWKRLDLTTQDPMDLVLEYSAAAKASGEKPFIDSGHFELPRTKYP